MRARELGNVTRDEILERARVVHEATLAERGRWFELQASRGMNRKLAADKVGGAWAVKRNTVSIEANA